MGQSMPPNVFRSGLEVRDSLPEEVAADERKSLARHISLKIEWSPVPATSTSQLVSYNAIILTMFVPQYDLYS